ncbi:C-type lectin domain family 4 member E-like [Denticeps clupeoides]|uniref:C-type lectin domain family 4 member E-like n=1 Tax=Denticeps clupeoides TaxID=299321 RepID=UPI0010A2DD13|nr:C-type lectin domain family 4 member E-like [Denticeps clupeoides]
MASSSAETYRRDDFGTDDMPFCNNSEDLQEVSILTVRGETGSGFYRLASTILGLLSVLFLVVIIGMSVLYSEVSGRHDRLALNSSQANGELESLKADYKRLAATKSTLHEEFGKVLSEKKALQVRLERAMSQIVALRQEKERSENQLKISRDSCGRCPQGWRLLNATCYYFSDEGLHKRGWEQSRQDCVNKGGDLAVVDTQEKQEFVSEVLQASRLGYWDGFWIGLKDDHTEGVWKWRDGASLERGYWREGEPNDFYSAEDCAATYPTSKPLEAWNDAPCNHPLKWICEMSP